MQPCDLTGINSFVRWSLVRDIGSVPTFAQKIVALGGRPFWLNKYLQYDSYSADVLGKCCPSHLWIYVFNALGPSLWLLLNPDLMSGLYKLMSMLIVKLGRVVVSVKDL